MTTQPLDHTGPGPNLAPIALLLAGAVFLLMMVVGVVMRGAQADLIAVNPILFYQLMTAHGIGMVGAAGFSGAAIMWYFLGRHVSLSRIMAVLLVT